MNKTSAADWLSAREERLCIVTQSEQSKCLIHMQQPSASYCHLLKLPAHPFTNMSELTAAHKQTGTFVYINNYWGGKATLLTSPLEPSVSWDFQMQMWIKWIRFCCKVRTIYNFSKMGVGLFQVCDLKTRIQCFICSFRIDCIWLAGVFRAAITFCTYSNDKSWFTTEPDSLGWAEEGSYTSVCVCVLGVGWGGVTNRQETQWHRKSKDKFPLALLSSDHFVAVSTWWLLPFQSPLGIGSQEGGQPWNSME